MNRGPLLFLGIFFTMSLSWVAFVLAPQLQFGAQLPDKLDNLARFSSRSAWQAKALGQPVKDEGSGPMYPTPRTGLAQRGLQVYRANGCYYCHSQQVRQTGLAFDVYVAKPDTNVAQVVDAALKVNPKLARAAAQRLITQATDPLLTSVTIEEADAARKKLEEGGAKAQIAPVPTGPDINRHWGPRASVGQDFLYDYPVMAGSQRLGPDLSNTGIRQSVARAQLSHLYNPRMFGEDSTMPPYRHLFEKRKMGRLPSPEALNLASDYAPESELALKDGRVLRGHLSETVDAYLLTVISKSTNPEESETRTTTSYKKTEVVSVTRYEIIPSADAFALAAYLVSLHGDTGLFEASVPRVQPDGPSPIGGEGGAPPAGGAAPDGDGKAKGKGGGKGKGKGKGKGPSPDTNAPPAPKS